MEEPNNAKSPPGKGAMGNMIKDVVKEKKKKKGWW